MAPWQTMAVALGTIAFWLLIPVAFLGRLRAKMGLVGNRWFKRAHLLAYAAWPLATAHYVLAGTDALAEWSLALLFAGGALIVMALLARGFVPAPGPVRPIADKSAEPLTSA
jgi:DMSO/TMAO reductase YedYZ heme-binding membrane subunit